MRIRTIGPHIVGVTALIVLGLATGAAVVGVPAATDATNTSASTSTSAIAAPAQPMGNDAICAGLRARYEDAMNLHPSDAAQARIAAQTMLGLHC